MKKIGNGETLQQGKDGAHMQRLFEAIEKVEACEPGAVNLVLSALDEAHLGEKALVSGGKLLCEG